MSPWDTPLEDVDRDDLIEKVAKQVTGRRLEVPAILFLEMSKPLTFLASQSLIVSSPVTAPFMGIDNLAKTTHLLEKRENVERLIRRIEDLTAQRDAKPAAEPTAADSGANKEG